ncbi:MAG: ATP-binding protein, partial [candidate division Zixibacteria bacterium]|nr:ATP-binding protein [candidate division Zixibacteria bacterium]
MHPRKIHDRLTDLLSRYPAVMLLGPRGVGKTTLARQFSDLYYDIEHPEDLIRLDIEWGPRMRGRELMVLDEIHTVPELFLRLLPMIDEQRSRNGRFLMTESMASPLLKSLEGRCVLCELPPFLIGEMPEDRWDDLWMTGGYPVPEEVSPSFPDRQRICLKGMSQRDLPNWGFPAPPRVTEQLFRMLAAAHGQIWNASEIGRSLGISYHTADTYT